MNCPKCGMAVPSQNRFCTSCGNPVADAPSVVAAPPAGSAGTSRFANQTEAQSVPSPAAPAATTASPKSPYDISGAIVSSRPQPFDPATLHLAHGEVIKRVHEVGRLERGSGWVEGTLVLTDSRILYRARAKNFLNESTINREIQLADVNGLALSIRRGMSPAGLVSLVLGTMIALVVIPLIGGIFSIFSSFGSGRSSSGGGLVVFLALLVIAVAIYIGFQRAKAVQVGLVIFAKDVGSSPISFSGSVGDAGGIGMILALLGMPLAVLLRVFGVFDASEAADAADVEATRALYEELGALILDLQSRGVLGAS